MKKNLKLALLFLLVALLALGVTGCGKKKNVNTINKDAIYKEIPAKMDLPEGFEPYRMAISDNNIFMEGYVMTDGLYENAVLIFDANGNQTGKYAPTSVETNDDTTYSNSLISSIAANKKGDLFVSYSEYIEKMADEDNYEYEENYYIVKADATGKEVEKVELSTICEVNYIDMIYNIEGKGLMFSTGSDLVLLDENLKLIKQKQINDIGYIDSVIFDRKGQAYIKYWGTENIEIHPIDLDTLSVGEDVKVSFNASYYTFYSGNANYDILLSNSTAVYGYNFGDVEPTLIMNMVDSDIAASGFNALTTLADGSFMVCYTDWNDDGANTTVSRLEKVAPEDVKEKEILTLGCVYLDYDVRNQVIDFNKSSDSYRITIKDYSIYNTDEDYNAGQKKLNSDIASGQVPDILLSNDPSLVANYASKGLFVDLHKFLDNDPEIDINDIFPNLLKACETDGKLYQMAPYFSVRTIVAKKSNLGGRTSWTFNEMAEYEKTLPEGTELFYAQTREEFLNSCIAMDYSYYIDMAKGKCNFDSQEFIDLLTYAKGLPEGNDEFYDKLYAEEDGYDYASRYRLNKTILYPLTIYSPRDFTSVLHGYMGEELTYIGYPTSDGNGSSLYFYNSFAISSKSANADVAWSFAKTYLSKDYQAKQTWNIPASMSRFDELCKEAMERPYWINENGDKEYFDNTIYINGEEIPIDPLNQAEVDELKNFILSVEKLQCYMSEDIFDIINEEAGPFYDNQKSAEEVAPIIQSRISLYIKEQQ